MTHIKKEYGIKVSYADGRVEVLNYETYNSAESAAYDYECDLGSDASGVDIVVHTMFVSDWEVLDRLDRPAGEDARREHIIEIGSASIQDSIEELLEEINRE